MKKVFGRPSPAMGVAIVALIVALGGTAIAGGVLNKKKVNKIITNRAPGLSVSHAKTADSASTADSAKSLTSPENLKLPCPAGTLNAGGTCVESTARAAASLEGAMNACADAGRRLPTPSEYRTLSRVHGITISGSGEQTTVYGAGNTNVIAVQNGISISNDQSFARPFRCATSPGS
jgi:hypothetical protein